MSKYNEKLCNISYETCHFCINNINGGPKSFKFRVIRSLIFCAINIEARTNVVEVLPFIFIFDESFRAFCCFCKPCKVGLY